MAVSIKDRLVQFRFECLLVALVLVLFDKAFVKDEAVYTQWVWPINMIALGVASRFIFHEKRLWLRIIVNTLFILTVLIPLVFAQIAASSVLTELAFLVYIVYYGIILVEVIRQIFSRNETNMSVIFGSVSGFLLLIFITQFVLLHIEFSDPGSFSGLSYSGIPNLYNQLSYFSMVSLATVGYGEIAPVSDSARLITMFFALCGQFYMVALVGIIVSRYSSHR